VPTHVVESIDSALAIPREDNVESCDGIAKPVTCLGESRLVREEQPPLGEYGASLEVVHILRGIP
jgi:hypothetical protein